MKRRLMSTLNVTSVEDYFKLPKCMRVNKWGLYLTPRYLPFEGFSPNKKGGWREWEQRIKEEFPVQWFLREWIFSYENPVYSAWSTARRTVRGFWWKVKILFNPCAPRMRKSWRRWEYKDISEAIVDINFALIQDFWYEEVIGTDFVNWESEITIDFYNWIKSAVRWIEEDRVLLQRSVSVALDNASSKDGKDEFRAAYKKVEELEEKINSKDEQILTEMIRYRERFWS